ncbi:class F sortase [Streptomyces seoulensis]|uniref:class F sortase n=1 Tax=Streptomyces seoulensis TaxID=73044 RepID=UPI001FCCBFE9|nr:class F sortase [Streptomyces seoulensis]BDH06563.1 class F sortase [Streptomyces seoulensis]
MAPGPGLRLGRRISASRDPYLCARLGLACAMAAGAVLLISGVSDEGPSQPRPSQAGSTAAVVSGRLPGASADLARLAVAALPPAEPVRLRIGAIGVDAPMARVGLDAAGALRAPAASSPGVAGWYGDGTAPGTAGTAIATGHVDTPTGGPGVFYNLGDLTEGATIEISRADRRTVVFTVRAVELHDRKNFPSRKVYGSTGRPELRLITCGGRYVKGTGYQSNVVVYATLTAVA